MGAAHCEYAKGVIIFVSSRHFNSLSTSGKAAYGIGHLGWKTGLVDGLSENVASA